MTPKHYSTFKEIDTRLKILKLQRAIEKEKLICNYKHVKYLLYPQNIAMEIRGIIKQKLIALVLNRFPWVF